MGSWTVGAIQCILVGQDSAIKQSNIGKGSPHAQGTWYIPVSQNSQEEPGASFSANHKIVSTVNRTLMGVLSTFLHVNVLNLIGFIVVFCPIF